MRVLSTPTWPVPYYDRAFRHPVALGDINVGSLSYFALPLSDVDVVLAKESLKLHGLGHVVEAVEQHWKINTYCTAFGTSKQFCEAYVDDLLDCLGVAHE